MIKLLVLYLNEINLLVHGIMSERFESLHPEPCYLRVRPMRIIVNNHYCHLFPFVNTENKMFPDRHTEFLVFMAERWLMILLQMSPFPQRIGYSKSCNWQDIDAVVCVTRPVVQYFVGTTDNGATKYVRVGAV